MKNIALCSLLAWLAAAPLHVLAADAYVSVDVRLRAGPDIGYPMVAIVPAGATIRVEGCIDGWAWCDVAFGGMRGWVAASYIEYEYQGRPVLVTSYGARIGIPIVTFSIGSYWDRHYVGRPFYRERERWYRQPPPRHAPPPPPRQPYPPRRRPSEPPGREHHPAPASHRPAAAPP